MTASRSTSELRGCSLARFDWTEYVVLAEELRQAGGEARLRSAISRAYYAVCMQVREHRLSRGPGAQEWDHQHAAMWSYIRRLPNRIGSRVGRIGLRMLERRADADYKSDYGRDLEVDAALSIEDARELQGLLPR